MQAPDAKISMPTLLGPPFRSTDLLAVPWMQRRQSVTEGTDSNLGLPQLPRQSRDLVQLDGDQ
jgi:hypothetical protein